VVTNWAFQNTYSTLKLTRCLFSRPPLRVEFDDGKYLPFHVENSVQHDEMRLDEALIATSKRDEEGFQILLVTLSL
jgi:hypothetical protein